MFGENNNYHQIGNGYLQYELTVGNCAVDPVDRSFAEGGDIRLLLPILLKRPCFQQTEDQTENNEILGQVSTI